VVSERRIYGQKQAALSFIDHLNLPGNAGYDATRPADQVMVLAYNDRLISGFPTTFSADEASDATALQAAIQNAGRVNYNPYLMMGGTNWAVGLYAAAQHLAAAAPSTTLAGTEYRYDQRVIFITDGITNHFFREESPIRSAGQSNASTYPLRSACRALGVAVLEDAWCQTTEGGGTFNGMDRPLTQAAQITRERLHAAGIHVHAIAMAHFDTTLLRNEIASSAEHFVAVPENAIDATTGLSTLEQIMHQIVIDARAPRCHIYSAAEWVEQITPPHLGLPLEPERAGTVTLQAQAGGMRYTVPIQRDLVTGAVQFTFTNIPTGTYDLTAQLFYTGADGVVRDYQQWLVADVLRTTYPVVVEAAQVDLGMLGLISTAEGCGEE
jgi:hypothetical protein